MKIPSVVAGVLTALLLTIPGRSQSSAELLQKGIFAQETAGDLDSAIQIFRQVANPANNNKSVAAQAQYQLVLCMLQRGDRTGAGKEVETLARNFPDQQEMVSKARKLLPGSSTALPAPWGESEVSQLNIKRDGAPANGEYLYYSVDPAYLDPYLQEKRSPNEQILRWELTTKKSKRSVVVKVDRSTGQPIDPPVLESNDDVGDPTVELLTGPAIDIEQSIFAIRRLPLAVGYKTTLSTLPFALGKQRPNQVELSVVGIEPIEVTAGKFRCYKVTMNQLGQTFWFGVEGARPLVKFQHGNTEAELVKVWGPENFIETELKLFHSIGWKFERSRIGPGPEGHGGVHEDIPDGKYRGLGFDISAKKIYTPAAEIPQALRDTLPKGVPHPCRTETIQTGTIAGLQTASCILRLEDQKPNGPFDFAYRLWIRTESAAIELSGCAGCNVAVFRWQVERALAAAKGTP